MASPASTNRGCISNIHGAGEGLDGSRSGLLERFL